MPDLPAVRHRTEAPRSTRLDQPRDTRRLRRPHLEDDAFGRFATKTLDLLSEKVNKEALVSVDFTAKASP